MGLNFMSTIKSETGGGGGTTAAAASAAAAAAHHGSWAAGASAAAALGYTHSSYSSPYHSGGSGPASTADHYGHHLSSLTAMGQSAVSPAGQH